MIKTIQSISSDYGFTEDEIRNMVYDYVNQRPNMIFNWDEFVEFLIIENRDKKLEKILNKD
jgi:hypothetical protein